MCILLLLIRMFFVCQIQFVHVSVSLVIFTEFFYYRKAVEIINYNCQFV